MTESDTEGGADRHPTMKFAVALLKLIYSVKPSEFLFELKQDHNSQYLVKAFLCSLYLRATYCLGIQLTHRRL